MTKLEEGSSLDEKIYIKRGNKPKIIKLIQKARELESQQEKLKQQFVKLTADDLEDYFWDCVYSVYPVERDLRELFTSKWIDWK